MSYRVFVVCEDHTLDQFVAVPVISALLKQVGKPKASVRAVSDPRLQGISQVFSQHDSIASRYAAIGDLVIFVVDRDAVDGSDRAQSRLDRLRGRGAALPAAVARKVLYVCAVEETEVWALWGSRGALGVPWAEVRANRDPKEAYFYPLLTASDWKQPGEGRARLIQLSLANGWGSLVSGCEELADLEAEVAAVLS